MPNHVGGNGSARFKLRGPHAKTVFKRMSLSSAMRPELAFLFEIKTETQFLEVVETKHPVGSAAYEQVKKAYRINESAFKHERRKSGEPYSRHSVRIALILMLYLDVWDPDLVVGALLHDIMEKHRNRWRYERLVREFNENAATHIAEMTRPKETRKLNKRAVDVLYHLQLAGARRYTKLLKGVDRWDNVLTMWKHTAKERAAKLVETWEFILPLIEEHDLEPFRKLSAGLRSSMELLATELANGDT
ncbi:MAG: HD domain-containing protein [Patescibacteria group bacterium]